MRMCTAAKPKTMEKEEVATSAAEQNISGNSSQDREFILYKNERFIHVKNFFFLHVLLIILFLF